MKKLLLLSLTFSVVYVGALTTPVTKNLLSAVYQPSVVDILDPSRARLA